MRSCPADYEFIEAESLDQALKILSDGGWRPMAGGTDLMVLYNAGVLPYRKLVSIRQLSELKSIHISPETVTIGAGATYAAIASSEIIKKEFPFLYNAATWTGSIANQNRGTLGGNIANGSPAADSPPALLVYDAMLELVSLKGKQLVPYSDFHTGYKAMKLSSDSLILAIHLPRANVTLKQYCRKVGAREAQAISKVSFHATAQMEGNLVRDFRLALGSVAPYPLRCRKVENILIGQTLSKSLMDEATQALTAEISPIDDIRSTSTYRTRVSQNLLGDFLHQLS